MTSCSWYSLSIDHLIHDRSAFNEEYLLKFAPSRYFLPFTQQLLWLCHQDLQQDRPNMITFAKQFGFLSSNEEPTMGIILAMRAGNPQNWGRSSTSYTKNRRTGDWLVTAASRSMSPSIS